MLNNWRLLIAILLIIGFPAWFVFWIKNPNVLMYLYALMGYLSLTAYLLISWGIKKL